MRDDSEQSNSASSFEFKAHPAERRRDPKLMTVCCGCCCCCCCLHTLGGLIGAAVATAKGRDSDPGHWGGSVYWVSLCGCAVTTGLIVNNRDMMLIMLVVLPAIQLAASVLAAIAVLVMNRPDSSAALGRVGRITLWTFLGTLGGVGAMYLGFSLFR